MIAAVMGLLAMAVAATAGVILGIRIERADTRRGPVHDVPRNRRQS